MRNPIAYVLETDVSIQDFFYVCSIHLKDSNFCTPILDESEVAARKQRETIEREIEKVKKEYEERMKRKKEKEKQKKEKGDKDGKDGREEQKKSEKDEEEKKAEQEKDDKVCHHSRCVTKSHSFRDQTSIKPLKIPFLDQRNTNQQRRRR